MSLTGEWLETDGRGGFASGRADGLRTRRYHALLLTAQPDGRRFVLVNGVDVVVETAAGETRLSRQAYAGGHDDGLGALADFAAEPWPRFIWTLPSGARVELEIVVPRGSAETHLRWGITGSTGPATLRVRPFLSGRDYHALHHENPAFGFAPLVNQPGRLVFATYPGLPPVVLEHNGRYHHDPLWYRRFFYADEAARGLDCEEDLAAPGELIFDLAGGDALVRLATVTAELSSLADHAAALRTSERTRRAALGRPLHRAAEAYLIEGGGGPTVIAGYPWFTDWGRDTFIALRGLALATGRFEEARAILLRWAGCVSAGMLPNRFPDGGGAPEYNSVDAALWFVVAAFECLEAAPVMSGHERMTLHAAIEEILIGYTAGTRHRIGADADGLLAAGEPGVQLTWMDSKIGDWVVTPRVGKAVEIQALWVNALFAGGQLPLPSSARWRALAARAQAAFGQRYWNEGAGRLHDVVDVDHQPGTVDPTFRPNQILAVGGLPWGLLEGPRARAVVDAVEAALLTPIGLRSLAPGEPGYRPHYGGSPFERDSAYHQGTVWPWLIGPFVEAWVRVRGDTDEARAAARARFLAPLHAHAFEAGLGHVTEVADAEPPHTPGGCPFQAWSVGELVRLENRVLVERASSATRAASYALR